MYVMIWSLLYLYMELIIYMGEYCPFTHVHSYLSTYPISDNYLHMYKTYQMELVNLPVTLFDHYW